jgi:hypothetical protein
MTIEQLNQDLQNLKESFRRHIHYDGIETEKFTLRGIVAPGFTPKFVGLIYCDTTAGKVYISTNTTASSDWKLLN